MKFSLFVVVRFIPTSSILSLTFVYLFLAFFPPFFSRKTAAQQNHKEACFALTAWYLVGSPGILPQSDTEAYLWAKKAAEQGMAKAEYAVGYFTEVSFVELEIVESRRE